MGYASGKENALNLVDQKVKNPAAETAGRNNYKDKKGEERKAESPKRGRPKKGEIRAEKKEEKRLTRQINQTPAEALKDIPTVCNVGSKTNAQGYKETWSNSLVYSCADVST